MSKIKSVIIDFGNLTDTEQCKLWINLLEFAINELPDRKELMCYIIPKVRV